VSAHLLSGRPVVESSGKLGYGEAMSLYALARRLRRRPPFWLVLVFVVGTFTAVTGAVIGGLAWWENHLLFGAPFAREDAASQALRCAWAMQRAMAEVNIQSRKLDVPEIGMGIAIHSGRAVVGNIGSDDRVKYGAVGPPVNVAAHLQAHAGAGEILVSASTLARGGGIARIADARMIELKGRAAPVTVYPLEDLTDELSEARA
jgi:class 3 adenylate cyclase